MPTLVFVLLSVECIVSSVTQLTIFQMAGKNGNFIHCLKTRTPDLWGKCNNIHLSIELCDRPAGPSTVMAGGGGVEG